MNAVRHFMRIAYVAATILAVIVASGPHAADRKWQTGRWADVGVKRTPWIGDPERERMRRSFNEAALTEVATYVIETDDLRFDLKDMVAIGRGAFERYVIVGNLVTFAVDKKTAYIQLDGREYRLHVLKSRRKKPVS
jgi:hypothetical protein